MTTDFKTMLLKYLTGSFNVETGTNEPQFLTPGSNTNSLKTKLDVYFSGRYTIYGTIQGIDKSENGLSLTAIYGGYALSEVDTTFRGFVYIIDSNFEEVQMITEYSGGTPLGLIETMSVAQDGTFYVIEKTGELITPLIKLVLWNNFLLKLPTATEYEIVYRIGYTVPSTNDGYITSQVIKNENAGYYLIGGTVPNGIGEQQPIAKQVEIVVGGTNVWTEYLTATETRDFGLASTTASWDSNNNITFKMIGWLSDDLGGRNYVEYSNNSSNDLVAYMINPAISNVTYYTALSMDSDTTYVAYSSGVLPGLTMESMYLGYIDYNTNSIVNMFTLPSVSILENSRFYFFKSNNQPFYARIVTYVDGITKYKVTIGKIIGSNYYEKELAIENGLIYTDPTYVTFLNMNNQFNMYDYFVQVNDKVYTCKQIYNELNYNGLEYQALNSMITNSAILYNESDIVIFARNLYNRTIINNTTISSVQIPNNYLNDINIALQELYGETNSLLVSNSEVLTKNIYEEVLLNFINAIIMSNQNNTSKEIINNVGATRLNNSISNTMDYANCKITKYRTNYSDNSSVVKAIDMSAIVYDYTSIPTATYSIAIYVPTVLSITSVELISDDENTVYQTIDTSSLINNKVYNISQKVEVI